MGSGKGMQLTGHHIIGFVKHRWKLTKKSIAEDYLHIAPYNLSRKKPPNIDPEEFFACLFDVNSKKSAAYGDDECDILDMLVQFLIKEDCIQDVKFIKTKMQQNIKYKKLILELLRWTNAEQTIDANTPQNGKGEWELRVEDTSTNKNMTDEVPFSIESGELRTISRKSIFSSETMKLINDGIDPYHPSRIFDSINADLKRPLSTTKKK